MRPSAQVTIENVGVLSDRDILKAIKSGDIVISNFNEKNLNTNSYDLTLSNRLLKYKHFPLDPHKDNETEEVIIPEEGLIVYPTDFYLGATNEWTETHTFVPFLNGKSGIARLSVEVHRTACMGAVGYTGTWTLEIATVVPIILYPNMKICQIFYMNSSSEPLLTYDKRGHYNKNEGPQKSLAFIE